VKLFNNIFYFLLFVGFFLPTNTDFYLPLPGVLLKINELAFILLPIVNIFCHSKKRVRVKRKLKTSILLFILFILFTEFILKHLAYSQSVADSFKAFRLGLPLISSLLILYFGLRADTTLVWKTLLLAVGWSILISFLSLFIHLPIYHNLETGEDVLNSTQGRLINSNAPFGIIGLYLIFKDKDKWYNKGRLVKYVSILSVIALIFTFNRTYLALLVLSFVYISYKTFSRKTVIKIIFIPILLVFVSTIAYNNSTKIRNQVDKRILSIIAGQTTIEQSTVENNRDVIIKGVKDKIEAGYWMIGLPYKIPIFIKPLSYNSKDTDSDSIITDTSFVNILLRYGLMPLFLITLIFIKLYKLNTINIYSYTFIVFLVASLNTDSLFRQDSIFFMIMLFLISNFNLNEKNNFYSKNQFK
jgi:hypothetical protein